MCGCSREVVHTPGHAEVDRSEAPAEAKRQPIDSCSAARLKRFLALVVVPDVPAQLRTEVERDAPRHVTEKLIAPHPRVAKHVVSREVQPLLPGNDVLLEPVNVLRQTLVKAQAGQRSND